MLEEPSRIVYSKVPIKYDYFKEKVKGYNKETIKVSMISPDSWFGLIEAVFNSPYSIVNVTWKTKSADVLKIDKEEFFRWTSLHHPSLIFTVKQKLKLLAERLIKVYDVSI